ncbi:MAG: hypothetical protein KC561_11925, partial [Myxococcales bacterium]|nr:hypothetical protein [Myxococcales bacterium]
FTELEPMAVCTMLGCPEETPCCNACSVEGWEANGLTVVPGPEASLPTVTVDGCGEVEGVIVGWGEESGGTFILQAWEQRPAGSVPSGGWVVGPNGGTDGPPVPELRDLDESYLNEASQ